MVHVAGGYFNDGQRTDHGEIVTTRRSFNLLHLLHKMPERACGQQKDGGGY